MQTHIAVTCHESWRCVVKTKQQQSLRHVDLARKLFYFVLLGSYAGCGLQTALRFMSGAEIFRSPIAFRRSLQSVQRPEGSSINNVTLREWGLGGVVRLLWHRERWRVRNIVTSQKSQVLSMILCRLAKLILQLGNSLAFDERTEGGLFPVRLNGEHCFVWCFALVKW